jgi:hypothetical protein
MKVKPKKCASTKTKDFGCSKLTEIRKLGLCMDCYPKWLYSTQEGQEMIKKHTIPLQKKRDDFKAAEKDYLERKTIGALLKQVENVCHEYIRLRDLGKQCHACGALWNKDFQASHFYAAGKYSSMKFDEDNIWGCDVGCNIFKQGNIEAFRIRLTELKGEDFVKKLDEKASQYNPSKFKWDRENLKNILKYYQEKLKKLKQNP